jgi:hypothetical protein
MIGLVQSLQPGRRIVDAGELLDGFQALFGSNTAIIATAAAPGPVLNAFMNFVNNTGNVTLPPAIPGRMLFCLAGPNSGTGITINPTRANLSNNSAADQVIDVGSWAPVSPVVQANGAPILYICYLLGFWIQITL